MAHDLNSYRSLVEEQPPLDDIWFAEALARNRQGDAQAHSAILGSCMRLALAGAERVSAERSVDPFDLLQEANSAVKKALKTFTGSTVAEFSSYVEQMILDRLEGY